MRKFLLFSLLLISLISSAQTETRIAFRCTTSMRTDSLPLLMIDGKIIPSLDNISADSIAAIEVLKGPTAAALFGVEGAYGAIIMESTKAKREKNKVLKEVIVGAGPICRCRRYICCRLSIDSAFKKAINNNVPASSPSIKIYPNPVNRNSFVNVDMKEIEPGKYSVQLLNSSGQLVQQESITATGKQLVSQIAVAPKSAGTYILTIQSVPGNKTIYRGKLVVL